MSWTESRRVNMWKEWERFKVPFVHEGERGGLKVERFSVSEEDSEFDRMRSMISFGSRGRFCLPGTYTRLRQRGTIWMSDTRDEILDHRFLMRCHGSVLVHGLGLGVALNILIQNPNVEKIEVVEINEDVVELVWPWFKKRDGSEKVEEIRIADALDYDIPRGTRYDFAWHDIWPTICGDNWESMKRLHRRFARRVTVEQDSWQRDRVKEADRESREFMRSQRQWI